MSIDNYNIQEILENPKSYKEIHKALEIQRQQRLHVTGHGYHDWWLKRVINLESERAYEIKKEICAITTPRMMEAVKKQYYKIFRAKGRVFNYNLNETQRNFFNDKLSDVCHGLSMDDVMQVIWHDGMFEDQHALIGVELEAEEDLKNGEAEPYIVIYPTQEIHDICIEGGEIEYLVLKTTVEKLGIKIDALRFIDEYVDSVYIKEGSRWVINIKEDGLPDSLQNEFGKVPFIQLSNTYTTMFSWFLKNSPITNVLSDLKKYLSISDDHYLTVKYHQHPLFYSYPVTCPTCNGSKEIEKQQMFAEETLINAGENLGSQTMDCGTCNAQGVVPHWKRDITQGITLPIVEAYETNGFPQALAPAGYVAPPIEALEDQRKELAEIERAIEKGVLGIEGIFDRTSGGNETATGRELDMQPLIDTLSSYSANAESVRKFLTDLLGKIYFGANWNGCEIFYGRKYFVRSEDNIMRELEQARKSGATISYLKELQDELTYIRFERNPEALSQAMILNEIEPFNGYTFTEMNSFLFINRDDYVVKTNFNDYVERFETDNGRIIDYVKSGTNYKKKLQEIKLKFTEYARETETVTQIKSGTNPSSEQQTGSN